MTTRRRVDALASLMVVGQDDKFAQAHERGKPLPVTFYITELADRWELECAVTPRFTMPQNGIAVIVIRSTDGTPLHATDGIPAAWGQTVELQFGIGVTAKVLKQ